MDLLNTKIIKELFLKYNVHPSKMMGQNFLVDKSTLNKIIETANLNVKDIVLEVGPGIGTLTNELAKRVRKVIAVEKDRAMTEILKETLRDYKNIDIIQDDILRFDSKKYGLKNGKYKIVANIPYYLTSPLIRKFLETENSPSQMILMIQKEVAQRICSSPHQNSKRTSGVGAGMSLLSVSVQFYAKPEIVSYVPKGCFLPKPKVDSSIIKIVPCNSELISTNFRNIFFKIVKAGFSHPRKQLTNNLSVSLTKNKEQINSWLLKNKIDPKQRAETLSVNDWINLTNSYKLL